MSKKPSLSDVLRKSANNSTVAAQQEEKVTKKGIKKEIAIENTSSSRANKKLISGHFDKPVSTQLKQIALDEETSIQQLLSEALNDLFVKKKKSPIA